MATKRGFRKLGVSCQRAAESSPLSTKAPLHPLLGHEALLAAHLLAPATPRSFARSFPRRRLGDSSPRRGHARDFSRARRAPTRTSESEAAEVPKTAEEAASLRQVRSSALRAPAESAPESAARFRFRFRRFRFRSHFAPSRREFSLRSLSLSLQFSRLATPSRRKPRLAGGGGAFSGQAPQPQSALQVRSFDHSRLGSAGSRRAETERKSL